MGERKSNGRKIMGKTAVISAVFIMAVMTTTVLAGCQNSVKKEAEIPSENVRIGVDTELSKADDGGLMETDRQEQPTANDIQAQPEQSSMQALQDSDGNISVEQSDTEQSDKGQPEEKKEPPEGWELTLASQDWGLSFGEPGTQPQGNASVQDLAWYDAYYIGDDTEKVIYLTFDCGYENGNTEPILDALKKHNAKATFFVVGHFLETAPEMAKRMVEEGHAVGNHTYHHLDMPTISDEETFRKEMDDVADLFQEITGTELSSYYRPPQGKCNVENLNMAHELGYKTIFWSLAYVDWDQDNQPSHGEAFDKLTTRVHPGAVVLLHNTSATNGEILGGLLTRWEEMGYMFKPLPELTGE